MNNNQNKANSGLGHVLLTIIFITLLVSVVAIIYGVFANITRVAIVGGALAFVMLMLILLFVRTRNDMIRAYHKVEESLRLIDIQLKQRFDLIPNLVEVVKGYTKHEKEVFKEITKLRTLATKTDNEEEKLDYANKIVPKLREIVAIAEDYPDLKADALFKSLMAELILVEDKIAAARRFYDSNVAIYNTKLEIFPNSIIANMFGYTRIDMFRIDAGEKINAVVKFK